MSELLKFNAVDICYYDKCAVRDISFDISPGEILGIAGESGSGKSTIIKAALGILPQGGAVTAGDILFNGINIPDASEKELRGIRGAEIGMIFQDAGASLCPVRTIGDQIFESMSAHMKISKYESKKHALELFEKLGFKDGERILSCYPFEMSGGMNQRIGIAMAMLLKPEILLADEPTSALDVTVQKQVVEELLLMRETYNTAIILVTHNIGVIKAMADKVMLLKEGRIVEFGEAESVLNDPQEEYTKKLLSAVPKLKKIKDV